MNMCLNLSRFDFSQSFLKSSLSMWHRCHFFKSTSMVGYESHEGSWNVGFRSDSFLNSLLFQFKPFIGTKEPFTSIASFIPNDSECFLLTVHFLKYWFMSNLVQIKSTRNIFGIKKKIEKIFDFHLLYYVYIIPGFNGMSLAPGPILGLV